jgi:ribulose-bisphosphate carboxylase large chain
MDQFVTATYHVRAKNMAKAVRDICIGQTIGNPDIRTPLDDQLREFIARGTHRGNRVTIRFPAQIFSHSGISHILSVVMGGQLDIDHIRECRLIDLDLSAIEDNFPKPRFGIQGIRDILQAYDRPLIGGIIKPKIGLSAQAFAEICRQMAKGGVDFIKEDEILNDQSFSRFSERIKIIGDALGEFRLIYAPCITGDGNEAIEKAQLAAELGLKAVHMNIWSGFGTFHAIRKLVNIAIFFQKSGDKVFTTGPNAVEFQVLCRIINLIGCDFSHVGMHGGYLNESAAVLRGRIKALGNTLPSFSCGAHPGLVKKLQKTFGNDIMISAGGSIHGHKDGVEAGARAFRDALENLK